MSQQLKAIAAMARNRVIGHAGAIPWRIPDELRWFKETTTGHTVVMGRKTYESLGRPLPNRRNVVITRGPAVATEGVVTLRDPGEVEPATLADAGADVFVIGGGEIYAQLLPRCTELLLTVVSVEVEGDTHFPEFESMFEFAGVVRVHPQFEVRRYRRIGLSP